MATLPPQNPNDNAAWRMWVGTTTTVVPATIAVALRFIARRISHAGFWLDDYTILLSLIVNWSQASYRWAQIIHYDYGRHKEFVPAYKLTEYYKSFLAIQIIYFANAVITKTSILLLYKRIFGHIHLFHHAFYVALAVVWSYFVACTITAFLSCRPLSYFWDKDQPGRCIDQVSFFRWNGIANAVTDVGVLILPLPWIWHLKASVRTRILIIGTFSLGLFVCITSIFRIIAFNDVDPRDPTYTQVPTATWSCVEQSVGIICACLPTLKPLLRKVSGINTTVMKGYTRSSGADTDGIPLSEKPVHREGTELHSRDETLHQLQGSVQMYPLGGGIVESSATVSDGNNSPSSMNAGITMKTEIRQDSKSL